MNRFAINFLLQVSTAIIPSFILLIVVPILTARIDVRAFAAFSVIISMIGFLAVLDGGVGRAATFFVSRAVSTRNNSHLRISVQACLLMGIAFSLFVIPLAWAALNYLDGPSILAARNALQTLLLFTPAIICGSVMKGTLEGQQRFALSSALQLFQGIVIGAAPIFMLSNADDLVLFTLLVGLVRLILLGLQIYLSRINIFKREDGLLDSIAHIFNYSKWLFISNLVGLVIVFADRILVASKFDFQVVASYMLPMEIIARSMIFVSAFASVIFPRLINHATEKYAEIFEIITIIKIITVSCTLCIGFILLPFIDQLLGWWMGAKLGNQAGWIILVGLIGVALASSSAISMMGINSLGHTRQIAFLHIIELPVLVILLYIAGEVGSLWLVQLAWICRLMIDALGMSVILRSIKGCIIPIPHSNSFLSRAIINHDLKNIALMVFLAGVLLCLGYFSTSFDRLTIVYLSIPFALGAFMLAYKSSMHLKIFISNSQSSVI